MKAIDDLAAQHDALASAFAFATHAVAFTGAGISTESGVPDFRTPGSPWLVNKPIDYQQFLSSAEWRRQAWRRKFAMDDVYRGAQPSRGHLALAALTRSGPVRTVVTQNIDGLHQAAGVAAEDCIELHGNGGYARCMTCHTRHEIADIRATFDATGDPPPCRVCGGIVKSATISFGESLPGAAMARARRESRVCDLWLVIGSSLVVFPAAALPVAARESGARLVIINREPTQLDGVAHMLLRGEIGDILAPFIDDASVAHPH